MWADPYTGAVRLKYRDGLLANPTNAFFQWLNMLHLAQVFGLPYRIFVSAMGVLIVTLSITGVLIWMKKRAARLMRQSKDPERQIAPDRRGRRRPKERLRISLDGGTAL